MAGSGSPANRMTYSGYLRLDELLQLQTGPEGHSPLPSNDEMHFIITHQAFELWFKQVRAELDAVHGYMGQESVDEKHLTQLFIIWNESSKSFVFLRTNGRLWKH